MAGQERCVTRFEFVDASHSITVRCTTCGAKGLPGGRWQQAHRRGHKRCPRCGRQLTVKLDGTARVHTRCPKGGDR
jgi:DNA-directed RNA polymerase subunit RPC12/RpoP